MLRKKYVVQKTLRLDGQLSDDLEILSKILDRPQNELMNLAIEKLILENKTWFTSNILVDYCSEFVDGGAEELEVKLPGVILKLWWEDGSDNLSLNFKVIDRDRTTVLDEHTYSFADTDQLIDKLRELYHHVDPESPQVEEYLKHRLDYR